VAGAIMSFSLTPDMAQAFKQRYKVDPSKVYQIVGACTAALGVPKRPQCDGDEKEKRCAAKFDAHVLKEFAINNKERSKWHDEWQIGGEDQEGRIVNKNGEEDLI
jgi:hypothetical protein